MLAVSNHSMGGAVPPTIRELTELRELYLANAPLLPLRMRYCGQRLPDVHDGRRRVHARRAPALCRELTAHCSTPCGDRWASTRGASSARSATK